MQLILGMGATGLSVAKFFAQKNIPFVIADEAKNPKLLKMCLAQKPNACYCSMLAKIPLIRIKRAIISPGIPQDSSIIKRLNQYKINIVSDIDVFAEYAKADIVGITGSNGKSTVAHLLLQMAIDANMKVKLGANIGIPALSCLSDDVDLYILELSSYQLDYLKNIKLKIAVVLNITPDHLERYQNFADYVHSKLSIYQYADICVVPLDEACIAKKISGVGFSLNMPNFNIAGEPHLFGSVVYRGVRYLMCDNRILFASEILTPIGLHNTRNILATLTLGLQIGLSVKMMTRTIKHFKGIAHRLEFIAKIGALDYYNDSKATNVAAAIVALETLSTQNKKHKNLVLIAGGILKKESYTPFIKMVYRTCFACILIGRDQQKLGAYFASEEKYMAKKNVVLTKIYFAKSINAAVDFSSHLIQTGVVLLSPACVSFDMFDNFSQRGDVFRQAVLSLKKNTVNLN